MNEEKKIPLKTDEQYWGKHDFVQVGDDMEEITIEITLAEYRSLVQSEAYSNARNMNLTEKIAALQVDNDKLRAEIEALKDGQNG